MLKAGFLRAHHDLVAVEESMEWRSKTEELGQMTARRFHHRLERKL